MSLDRGPRALGNPRPFDLDFQVNGAHGTPGALVGLAATMVELGALAVALRRAGNELPLAGLPTVWSGPTYWKLASVAALATGPASFKITNPNCTTLTLISVAATGRDRLEQQPQL